MDELSKKFRVKVGKPEEDEDSQNEMIMGTESLGQKSEAKQSFDSEKFIAKMVDEYKPEQNHHSHELRNDDWDYEM